MIAIKELKRMTEPELRQLKAQIDFELKGRKALPQQNEDWLFNGIVEVTVASGSLAAHGAAERLKRLHKGASYSIYKADSAKMLEALDSCLFFAAHRKEQLNSLGVIFARSLTTYLKEQHRWQIELQTLMENVKHIPAALAHSFPGYLQSGMIWALTGSMFLDEG